MLKLLNRLLHMGKLSEINSRFRRGTIVLTPGKRVLLAAVFVYVTVMIGLLIVKFAQILTGGGL